MESTIEVEDIPQKIKSITGLIQELESKIAEIQDRVNFWKASLDWLVSEQLLTAWQVTPSQVRNADDYPAFRGTLEKFLKYNEKLPFKPFIAWNGRIYKLSQAGGIDMRFSALLSTLISEEDYK